MRPRQTLINLISINASSSAAFPGGEAFRFAFSPNGQTVLALSTSRIYVLDVTSDELVIRKELKTLRRPLSASITDDGSLLAVLSSKHQANVYGLTPNGIRHLQVLVLDNPPQTIALAHEGTVLAAAYEGGVEVFSLAANALSTDRRAVRSEAMDTLQFSGDGSMLVGSSQSLDEPNAVVITAPFYTENDPDLSSREIHSRMWTTQILFPQITSICSHAELLQGHNEGDASWLFAYDHSLMNFRAVRTDDTRTGVAYFLSPPTSRRFSLPSPNVAPTASACGTLVAAGFAGSGLWLYGIPERLDVSPDMGSVVERHDKRMKGPAALTTATGHIEPLMAYSPSVSGNSEEIDEDMDSIAAKVDWRQSLFVKCRSLESLDGCSTAKWVEPSEERPCGFPGKRLVVVAPGGVNAFGEEMGDEAMPVDGSRLCLLDFDYSPSARENRQITIEVGENKPELLTEHTGDLAVEIAMERRRTVRGVQGRGAMRATLNRSVTSASHPVGSDYFNQGRRRSSVSQPSSPSEQQTHVASPPSRTPSGSQVNLHRSATSGGFRTARFPPRPPLGSQQYQNYGQAGYHQDRPQRSSRESLETPPPPYSGAPSPGATPVMNQQANGSHSPPAMTAATINGMNGTFDRATAAAVQGMHSPRMRSMGGSHLETVAELMPAHQSSRSVNIPYSAQPMPLHQIPASYFAPHGRPSTSNPPPEEQSLGLRPTITHPMSPPTPEREPTLSTPSPLSDSRPSPGSITLTGANLQNRLNHPVPPVPDRTQQYAAAGSDPVNHFQRAGPMQPPQHSAVQDFPPIAPTQDQMANLHRRMSQHNQIPLAVVTNGAYPQGSRAGQVPPSPPRGAWGAAGVPGSPSFNKAMNSPKGLARNNSTRSQRSIPISVSTPNLHAPQRPKYGRLDTIESIGSTHGHGEGPFRSRAQSLADAIPVTVREHVQSGMRNVTDPVYEGKKKRGKRKKGDEERSQMAVEGKQKKGSRCIVM